VTETPEEVIARCAKTPPSRGGSATSTTRSCSRTASRSSSVLAEYLTWISEADARIRSAHAPAWFRVRFPEWERQGLARWNPKRPRERQYRAIIVPLAADPRAVRADARRAAGE
jgi:hypothetical protein